MNKVIGLCAVFILILTVGCGGDSVKKNKGRAASKVIVSTAMAQKKDIFNALEVIGSVEPLSSVEVKSQANGIITEVHFNEGDFVKEGDLLFTIDQAPYIENLEQTRAQVKKSEAGLKKAESDYIRSFSLQQEARANYDKAVALVKQLEADYEKEVIYRKNAMDTEERYRRLLAGGFTTQEQYDKTKTDLDVLNATVRSRVEEIRNAQASVRASAASLESAKVSSDAYQAAVQDAKAQLDISRAQFQMADLELDYCTIKSPMSGVVGSIFVKRGNLVKASGDQTLVSINQIKPVHVACSVPEKYLPSLMKIIGKGEMQVFLTDGVLLKGKLVFIDNQIDKLTGTILIKAIFNNEERKLWPGQFIKSRILLDKLEDAVVIPSIAVQTGQKGKYVFVLGKDSKVYVKYVSTGPELDGEIAVLSGVNQNDIVITDGFLKLTDGMEVSAVM